MERAVTLTKNNVSRTGRNFAVSAEDLPVFLIDAKQAIENGDIKKANGLLNVAAIESIRKKLYEKPRFDIMVMLVLMFDRIGQTKKAEQWCREALEIERHPLILNKLASICQRTRRPCQAAEYRKEAVAKEPEKIEYRVNLATDLIHIGNIQQGIDMLREIVEKDPSNIDAHSKLLFYLHYLPELDGQMLFEEHRRWGRIHTPVSLAKTEHNNDPDPNRRLRIGYISPDFRMHSVAYFFAPLLEMHDSNVVEVYGYADVAKPDKFTEYLEKQFQHYRDISRLDDERIIEIIENDKIDILVDLAGHARNDGFAVLAYKPAPVLVTCLGYPDTTGMEQVDYSFTDTLADWPQSQNFYTEELFFLPHGFLCYKPTESSVSVGRLPAVKNGFITFGSFNNNMKINTQTISLWSRVLKANPGSRFVMKFPGADEKQLAGFYVDMFREFDITPDRIEFYGWKSPIEHLELYNHVDIALDTFPYNGTTTICEAMWMGVPTVSLVGQLHASRVGLSILSQVGLEFFAASSSDEYVKKANALAKNIESLEKIRASMRQRMLASSLCDAKSFASGVEAAYRKMWHKWCRQQGVDVVEDVK